MGSDSLGRLEAAFCHYVGREIGDACIWVVFIGVVGRSG